MSGIFDDSNRQVIPRWLDYHTSCALGLLAGARPQQSPLVVFPPNPTKLTDWEATPTLVTAADIVAESFILGTNTVTQAEDAARFILKHASPASVLIRELATTFLQQGAFVAPSTVPSDFANHGRRSVAILKRSVRASPVNPIAWSDLSLCYAMQGYHERARRAMTIALSLGPYNRFILRNAARCFLHLRDPGRAVHLLRQSGLCESDPWIAAAEIAVSEGFEIRSACLKHARSLVGDNNNSAFARSEIAATLSTIEAKSGSRRKAKGLIQQALVDPSENALAQIEWLATEWHTQAPPDTALLASFEAQTRHLHRAKQFAQSLTAAEKWVRFQPFSSRPLVLATFLASLCLNDDSRAIRITNEAAPANRRDPLLLNNLAFAHARLGDLTAAADALRMIKLSDLREREVLTVAATQGIVMFRSGNAQDGRALYRRAVLGFDRLSESRSAAIAAFFWACEEKRMATSDAPTRVADAKRRVKRAGVFELEDATSKL
jgi:tetratricopeptide (TPR) repeat protein